MKIYKGLMILCLLSLGLMTACDDELEEIPLEEGTAYFPTQEGHTLTYQVDTTFYDEFFDTVFTHSGQIREVFLGSSTDAAGNETVQIAHYSRSNDNPIAWDNITPRIWYISKNEQQLEKVEENLRFIKLSFPVAESQKWAGNSFIDTDDERWSYYDDWLYEYQNIGQSYEVNGQTYPNTLTVSQNDYADEFAAIISSEVYAKDVGMIYKEFMNLELIASEASSLEWPEKANQGQHIIMKLIP